MTSAGLTLLILLGFALLIGQLTATRLREDFDSKISLAAADLQDQLHLQQSFSGALSVSGPNLDDYASAENAVIRVVTPEGVVLEATRSSPPLGNPSSAPVTVAGYRVVARPIQVPLGFPLAWVQYARKPSEFDATINQTWFFLILGVVGGALLALLAGWALAKRAMRPIAGLTQAAGKISKARDPSIEMPETGADDEVADLARTLKEMLSSLDQARAETETVLLRQREFVADASHELRTPLTSILANLELLEQELRGQDGETELVHAAMRSSRRMRKLVSDLLILARADVGRQSKREQVDLAHTIRDVVVELTPIAKDHPIDASIPHGRVVVEGNADELHRLVRNLLENAIKHTPEGSAVEVDLARNNRSVTLTVTDHGPGIPAHARDRIFDRFYHTTSNGKEGTGLGLAIVRAVAESHGGQVTVSERPGGGACFEVSIPQQ